ncbi:ArsC/Spx/MgsR family protein [Paenirhodobacter sp. CAU 1674]|uniref:arsenate reductase family protein n=1 Tax=Paenirhodobacter sp. CAU 1674 TaxID=3032596 RepID=UPI0023DBD16C|nr:ArsC/Spx/MgsR family protein [Paenirhodobacter sp. CAU 1674]MDF2140264.1 arsenate reductase [Paenirhodobacter sp. CAU 1674]
MIVYGIKTCDTVKKALRALEAAGHAPVLRDVRAEPLSAAEIAEFQAAFGDRLINRASTTWRGLSEAERAAPVPELLAAHPTLMKRPVIRGVELTLGWDKAAQAAQGL